MSLCFRHPTRRVSPGIGRDRPMARQNTISKNLRPGLQSLVCRSPNPQWLCQPCLFAKSPGGLCRQEKELRCGHRTRKEIARRIPGRRTGQPVGTHSTKRSSSSGGGRSYALRRGRAFLAYAKPRDEFRFLPPISPSLIQGIEACLFQVVAMSGDGGVVFSKD